MYNEFPLVKERRKLHYVFLFLKVLSFTAIFCFLCLAGILIGQIANAKIIYQKAMNGRSDITYAVNLLKEKKYQSAIDFANGAEDNFSEANSVLKIYLDNPLVYQIKFLTKPLNNISYLLITAQILSRATKEIAQFGQESEGVFYSHKTFSQLTKTEKRSLLKYLYESGPELNGIKADIELALLNLNSIDFDYLFLPFKNRIENLDQQLIDIHSALSKAEPMSQLLPMLLGYPNKSTYLLILQNSDELRPTGGFIGTYGIIQTDSGDIVRSDTHDIYHMDMPIKDKLNVAPPAPLKKYLVDKWYMRDANWSPDWPTAAKQILWFYHTEDKLLPPKNQINNFNGDFSGVIAITPKLITDLLRLTGPIKINNVEYNENNFTNLLEYKVEKGYVELGIPSWQRKEIVGDILKEIKTRLFDQAKFYDLFTLVNNNLTEKNILFYFIDQHLEDLANEQNWSGTVAPQSGDYLMAIDANLASFKTDAVISRSINYELTVRQNTLIAHLTIDYSHHGKYDWRTTRYNTFTRIYAPLGSKFLKSGSGQKIDSSTELGKTVFSTYFGIDPGKSGRLEIYYQLPATIEQSIANNQYNLYLQKQPGKLVDSFKFDLNFNRNIQSYQPGNVTVYNLNQGDLSGLVDPNKDQKITINF